MRELVIDVSHCDKGIDLKAWRDAHGLWGVIVKCGGWESLSRGADPEHYTNSWYERHYANAKAVGVHVGAYYYTVATDVDQAVSDAEHCASILAGHDYDLPIYVDIEDPAQVHIGKRLLTDVSLAFIRRLRELGYNAGLYTYRSVLNDLMYGAEFERYPLWVAEYSDRCRTSYDYGMWQFGAMDFDGNVYTTDREMDGKPDVNWCYVDYPLRKGAIVPKVDLADVAAQIHYDMVIDERNGYSQRPERWGGDYGGTKTLEINGRRYTYKLGSYDCSSSVITAWRLALQGTPYEGRLNDAGYTGDMVDAFVNSGLFYANRNEPARRGDLYVNEGVHTAMCQDGGSDGVYGSDVLSEFNVNEKGTATYGEPGDQTGYESVFRGYYDDGWNVTIHYNHKADYDVKDKEDVVMPTQKTTKPKNDLGLYYQAHVQTAGWLPKVRDGQDAGTEGFGARLEGLRISTPTDLFIDFYAHVQGIGNLYYDDVNPGIDDGVIEHRRVLGVVGQARRMEAFMIKVTKLPARMKGMTVKYQGHVQGIGWTKVCQAGEWCGTRGEGRRLEAVRMWIE